MSSNDETDETRAIRLMKIYLSTRRRYNQIRYFGGWYQRLKVKQLAKLERMLGEELGLDNDEMPKLH